MLDIPVAEVRLQRSGVMPLVGKSETAGMAQHVRMGLEAQTPFASSALDHAGEACSAEGGTTLRCEHERRLGFLLALKAPQGS
jgi:hypothetical protein